MSEPEHGYTLDHELAARPVTRLELWRSMAMMRRQALDLHLRMMALHSGDRERIDASAAELDRVGAEIDVFMDDLLGVKPSEGPSK